MVKNMSISDEQPLFVSIGENCLADDILQRHGQKAFSTPYSFARSNIDYAIKLEETEYNTLLLPDNLYYSLNEHVVRSKIITECDQIYNFMHLNGFEFTHHDVIKDEKCIESYKRKINRMKQLKNTNRPICFLYHYRYNDNMDTQKIIKKAETFVNFYNLSAFVAIFYQNVQNKYRKLVHNKVTKRVITFEFFTPHIWQGSNQTIFFAKNEDDLIKIMLTEIQNFAHHK